MSLFISRNGWHDDKAYFFAPERSFDLELFAKVIVAVMRESGACRARAEFPDDVVIDLERGCTVEEIVGGYREFLAGLMPFQRPCNQNKSGPLLLKNIT